jgi:UDP-N-acetylmuramate dehydrogenase
MTITTEYYKMLNSLPTVQGEYKFNYNLSNLTWFKVGGPAQVFYKPKNLSDLQIFLKQINSSNITVLGAGSNIIIRDGGIDGIVIKLGQSFNDIELEGDKITAGASCLNFNLAKFCAASSIKGFEFLVGIPGTIGGGIAMNAGSYGFEFKDIIQEILAIDFTGNIHKFTNKGIGFGYRNNNLPKNLIFLSATFIAEKGDSDAINNLMQEIISKRSATQPIKERTGGSSFANPKDAKAWELIDKAGLRGYRINDASLSNLHCNFMINHGNASAKDLEDLGEFARQKVYETSGIHLEWEIKRIGNHSHPELASGPRLTIFRS